MCLLWGNHTELPLYKKRTGNFFYQSFNYIGRFVSFSDGLLHQGQDSLRAYNSVVDANFVNQAGPEGSRWRIVSTAYVKTADGTA